MTEVGSAGVRRGAVAAVVLCLLLALLVLLMAPAAALADIWSDISDAEWLSVYHVTATDAHDLAQGYPGNLFKPAEPVTRGQFAKMAVLGLDVPTLTPGEATFPDVPWGSTFYPYVEGAVAAEIIGGYVNGTYGPDDNLLRQQAYSILGKHLSSFEIATYGRLVGEDGTYANLAQWYSAEGLALLSKYTDASLVEPVHRAATAYLVSRQVVLGSQVGGKWYLSPGATLNRAPAVAMILRTTREVAKSGLPTITSVTPAEGPVGGGTAVVIQGHGFVDVTRVGFGNQDAESFTVNSGTSITAISPDVGSGRSVDISVTNSFGVSDNTPADNFTYLVAPVITLLSPSTGPTAGGNEVAIHGANFVGVSSIMFGDATVTAYVVGSSTLITATAPAHLAGDVTVQVTAGGGTSSQALPAARYTYGVAPTLRAVEPRSGPVVGGNTVTITGAHLSGATGVSFGAQAGQILTAADGTITAVVPAQPVGSGQLPRDEAVAVSVVTPVGTATLPAGYMYLLPPTLTHVDPEAGPHGGGQTVTIAGYHLFQLSEVTFGGQDATVVSTAADGRSVTVKTPAHVAQKVDVVVGTPGGSATLPEAYRFVEPPTITLLSPTSAPAAGPPVDVTITGTNFVDVTAVRFGTTNCVAETVNEQTLRVTVPSHAGGVFDVFVRAVGGEVTAEDAFTFTYTLSGVVKDDTTEEPIKGATVTIYRVEGATTTEVVVATTGADGTYGQALPPGTYKVKAEAEAFDVQWYNDKADEATANAVSLLSGSEAAVNFSLVPVET